MIVTIDGPAGSGKSSVARVLANRLGFEFLDTGAMYRCVTLAGLQKRMDLSDESAVTELAESITIRFSDGDVFIDDERVTEKIRTPEVTASIRYVADNTQAREALSNLQRAFASSVDCVTEGRDQGTEVFPDAECKIFLTASPEERARRRVAQLVAAGAEIEFETVLEAQNERDARDQQREVGRLVPADDAVEVCTDGMTQDEVVDRLESIARSAAANN